MWREFYSPRSGIRLGRAPSIFTPRGQAAGRKNRGERDVDKELSANSKVNDTIN